MEPIYLTTRHDPLLVAASLIVAVFASYVTLDLARRLRESTGRRRQFWRLGGSVAMGTGVWSMHFVAMLGFDPGMTLGYHMGLTAGSWIAAVAAAFVALTIATRDRLTPTALLAGSASVGFGVSTMHFMGMAALDLAPGIEWNIPLVLASIGIALAASAVALLIFFGLRRHHGWRRVQLQALAALTMGLAICGMHFTAMAAARLPAGSVCLSSDGLAGQPLAVLVTIATLLLLGGALILSITDAMAQARVNELTRSLYAANIDLRQANDELQRRAFEDSLSGLPNRALFLDRLRHAVQRVAQNARQRSSLSNKAADQLAVLFIDLDGFKPINDSFGHGAGDDVLREVARRLQLAVRDGDTLARLGGDEFVLLVESQEAETDATRLSQRMLEALKRPFQIGDREASLSCSIGIALYPQHDSGERLIACADAAMYAAKRAGGSTWVVYELSMSGSAAGQVMMQHALREALERDQLMLYYQPKVDADGRIHGLEALLRWRHEKLGLVSPATFIPLAERFGLIGAIGNWVIDNACAQLAEWHAQGLHCRIAINLSPHQLRQPELADRIRSALDRHQLQPTQLVCEITETAMMEHTDEERGMLDRIAALGVRLSIDDFGTGYSSLAHLRHIPARQIKIDRSFVVDLPSSQDARAVLAAVVSLAHALRMEVVAEGVETAEQQASLRKLGCDLMQGFFIARPMPAAEVPVWLAHRQQSPVTAPVPLDALNA